MRAAAGVVLAAVCGAPVMLAAQPGAQPAAQPGDFTPHFTIAEIMEAIVMPAADVVWNAPQFPEEGDELIGPATDEGWLAVRHAAVLLAESGNLLAVPGRQASSHDEKPLEGELGAAEIEALIAANRGAWIGYTRVLHAAGLEALAAIDARDVEKLLDAGGTVNDACEGCHKQFWYPNQ